MIISSNIRYIYIYIQKDSYFTYHQIKCIFNYNHTVCIVMSFHVQSNYKTVISYDHKNHKTIDNSDIMYNI